VGEALFTADLDLASVSTREDLARLLRTVHVRADRPSLRTVEAATRHYETPLSKTVLSEMLKGVRFPRKAVMASFLRVCGVYEDQVAPWLRAWERVADGEFGHARGGAPFASRLRLKVWTRRPAPPTLISFGSRSAGSTRTTTGSASSWPPLSVGPQASRSPRASGRPIRRLGTAR
jgi:hypothetical protein